MLATFLHMMQGTPYVYQGDELGMTNCPFPELKDFRDIESINAFHELTEAGKVSPEDMMRYLLLRSRDNARTPMQWDESANAGFTEGEPWIMVNPNYKEINAQKELADPDSVFHYYQKLIALRKQEKVMVYGACELLEPENENLYVYTRALREDSSQGANPQEENRQEVLIQEEKLQEVKLREEKLLVACNFTEKQTPYELPEEFAGGEILIGNYQRKEAVRSLMLQPYEALVIKTVGK